MKEIGLGVLLMCCTLLLPAQEVLTPLQVMPVPSRMPVPKGTPQVLPLPFFDDFATGTLDASRWQPGAGARVTMDVNPLAPTVGVLTLDAIDADGMLYAAATTSLFPADTVTSLPLHLDGLTAADSVVLSFYFMPGGGTGEMWERSGDSPDAQDSLFLDFYNAADTQWHTVWFCGGPEVEQMEHQWRYVAVAVPDNGYCDSAFRFRFRNYASLESTPKAGKAGNCDYWHLDYLMLDRGRTTTTETAVRDIAFAAPAPTMIKRYRAMPYRQYQPSDMADSVEVTITNRYNSELASQYGYGIYDAQGTELYAYDGGYENAPSFVSDSVYQSASGHAHPQVNYSFPTMTAPTAYEVVHAVREGSGGDTHRDNDTIRYRQRFDCYYAYDDGSAENGYSLTSTAPKMYLACRYQLNKADSLTAIDLFFNPTLDRANENIIFYLTVWAVGEDGNPGEVLYRDNTGRRVVTGRYHRYLLEEAVEVPSGTLFVGFEQTGNDFINLGYDRSYNTAGYIYYLTDGSWQQSFLGGSLMMRPCMGVEATVGMTPAAAAQEVTVYPNPATERLWVTVEAQRLELYDLQGRCVVTGQGNSLSVSTLADGLYLLRCLTDEGELVMKKVIIRH